MKSPELPPAVGAPALNFEAPQGQARGVTARVVVLCLGLAIFFGYISPIIDHKLANTFLGATHLPPGAVAVLLILLLVINPLLGLVSKQWKFQFATRA